MDCAKSVRNRFDLENLLVTRGPDGMCLVMNNDKITSIVFIGVISRISR